MFAGEVDHLQRLVSVKEELLRLNSKDEAIHQVMARTVDSIVRCYDADPDAKFVGRVIMNTLIATDTKLKRWDIAPKGLDSIISQELDKLDAQEQAESPKATLLPNLAKTRKLLVQKNLPTDSLDVAICAGFNLLRMLNTKRAELKNPVNRSGDSVFDSIPPTGIRAGSTAHTEQSPEISNGPGRLARSSKFVQSSMDTMGSKSTTPASRISKEHDRVPRKNDHTSEEDDHILEEDDHISEGDHRISEEEDSAWEVPLKFLHMCGQSRHHLLRLVWDPTGKTLDVWTASENLAETHKLQIGDGRIKNGLYNLDTCKIRLGYVEMRLKLSKTAATSFAHIELPDKPALEKLLEKVKYMDIQGSKHQLIWPE